MLVAAAGLTTVLGLAPVLLHRQLFRRQLKAAVVHTADLFLRAALAGVALVLAGTQLLIFDVVLSRRAGLVAAAVTLVVAVGIAVLPLRIRGRNRTQVTSSR